MQVDLTYPEAHYVLNALERELAALEARYARHIEGGLDPEAIEAHIFRTEIRGIKSSGVKVRQAITRYLDS